MVYLKAAEKVPVEFVIVTKPVATLEDLLDKHSLDIMTKINLSINLLQGLRHYKNTGLPIGHLTLKTIVFDSNLRELFLLHCSKPDEFEQDRMFGFEKILEPPSDEEVKFNMFTSKKGDFFSVANVIFYIFNDKKLPWAFQEGFKLDKSQMDQDQQSSLFNDESFDEYVTFVKAVYSLDDEKNINLEEYIGLFKKIQKRLLMPDYDNVFSWNKESVLEQFK